MRDPCLYGGCRRGNRSATERNRSRPSVAYPIVSVSAFLKLADWYRAFVSSGQGEQSCKDRKRGAAVGPIESSSSIVSEPALEGSPGRGSSANADDAEPDRGQAASTTSGREGG